LLKTDIIINEENSRMMSQYSQYSPMNKKDTIFIIGEENLREYTKKYKSYFSFGNHPLS
jgi:hypothetical protein